MKLSPSRTALAAATVLLAATAATTTAGTAGSHAAAAPHGRTVVAKNLLSPLSLAVNDHFVVFFSNNFGGQLFMKRPGKDPKVVVEAKSEIGAISTRARSVFFVKGTVLFRRTPNGELTRIANLARHERQQNPDGAVEYGIQGLSQECADQWPDESPAPPSYTGIEDSHPYASAVRGRKVLVADAGGNSIVAVSPDGSMSTVGLLPPVPVEITQEIADANGLPDCVVGETYRFEGVPTDVEVGPDDLLYVSSLPGGPEDGTAPGSVQRMDPSTGDTEEVVSDLVSAAGVAVADDGTIYVTQLFGGQVTVLEPGGDPTTFVGTALPSAVEVKGRRLWTTENVLSGLEPGTRPKGMVVRYRR